MNSEAAKQANFARACKPTDRSVANCRNKIPII